MNVTLPSGNTAEIRDVLLRGDRRAAHKAAKFTITADGIRVIDMSFEDDITGALLRRMLVAWSLPQTLPRNAASDYVAQQILDELPDDDYEVLSAAVRPFYLRLMKQYRDDEGESDPKTESEPTGISFSDGPDGQPQPSS